MASIRHFHATQPLPDWRNFGVILRILLGTNLLAMLWALLQVPDLTGWLPRYIELAGSVEPLLLILMGLLAVLRDWLWRLPLRLGQGLVVLLAAGLSALFFAYAYSLMLLDHVGMMRAIILAAIVAVVLLAYFELRTRAYSPAQTEARLAALNARIRPHFLFNSLNTVLSLIRVRPQEAEAALESLSDLFRAAMRDPAKGSSLADEIGIVRQYLELEKLRLGERLQVDWQIGSVPLDLPIPPLMLQPLMENAVYHGIEPMPAGGEIRIMIHQEKETLLIAIANPLGSQGTTVVGNQMALANIRERLALYYDLEARLEIRSGDGSYEVRIFLPCRRTPP